MTFVEGSDQQPVESSEGTQPEAFDPGSLSPYAQNFLNGIQDETHKAILPQYIKQWDSGFTQQVQKHTNALNEYRRFGSPQEIASRMEIIDLLDSNPSEVVNWLYERGHLNGYQFPDQQQTNQTAEQSSQQQFQLPPEFQQKFSTMEQGMQQIARHFLQQQEEARKRQEDEALEASFKQLRAKHGDFNETAVATLAAAMGSTDLEEAVIQWKNYVQQEINKKAATPPRAPMSASTLPPLAKKPEQMSPEERKSALVSFLNSQSQ